MNIRKTVSVLLLGALMGVGALVPIAHAEGTARRVTSKVSPNYPELAKRMNLRGIVRMEVVVAPSGQVVEVKALGGHPVLIPAAQEALRKWRFEPGPSQTTTVVEVDFNHQG